MPKEIEGGLKWRKSELLEQYLTYYSEAELIAIIRGSKTFKDKDLNKYIKVKYFTIEELTAYNAERDARITELQAIIDSLVDVPGQEQALAKARQDLQDYINSEEFEFIVVFELNDKFKIDPKLIVPDQPLPESEISKLKGSSFNNCIVGPEVWFDRLDISKSNFSDCTLIGSKLFNTSNIYNAKIRNCILREVNFNLVKDVREEPVIPDDPMNFGSHDHDPRPYDGWMEVLEEEIDSVDYSFYPWLSYIDFSSSRFYSCIISNKEIGGLNFRNTSFVDCNFDKLSIRSSDLTNCSFLNTSLTNSKIICYDAATGVNFDNCTLKNNLFFGLSATNTDFASQIFQNNRFGNCSFIRSNFSGIDLSNLSIQTSILTECSFSGAKVDGFSLIGSKLSNCNFSDIRMDMFDTMHLKNTEMNNCQFSADIAIPFSSLFNCKIKNMTFIGTDFTFTNFDSSKLENVRFENCIYNGVSSTDATLDRVEFINCQVRGVKFNRSRFINSKILDCDLSGTDFREANQSGLEIANCVIFGILE